MRTTILLLAAIASSSIYASENSVIRVTRQNLAKFNLTAFCEEQANETFRGGLRLSVNIKDNPEEKLSLLYYTCPDNSTCVGGGTYTSCDFAINGANRMLSKYFQQILAVLSSIDNDDIFRETDFSGNVFCSKRELDLVLFSSQGVNVRDWNVVKKIVTCP